MVKQHRHSVFRCFYNGFTQEKPIWYAYYSDNNTFELPVKFSFESIDTDADSMTSFGEAITPGILPVDFFTGLWQNRLNYSGSSAQTITIQATGSHRTSNRITHWSVGSPPDSTTVTQDRHRFTSHEGESSLTTACNFYTTG
jgi:hypothetical protein